jgi:UDP-N-acetyl-D-galactosamine dehydrogenase
VSRFGIKKRDFVVYESTVYPGCGRRCVPILENISELKGVDFKFGYSPERIVQEIVNLDQYN